MKKCLTCEKELVKHKTESKKRYEKKQFCSTLCARTFMKKEKIGWFGKQNSDFGGKNEEWL